MPSYCAAHFLSTQAVCAKPVDTRGVVFVSTQFRSNLEVHTPTSVSRNAMNPLGAKDLTALAATPSPVGRAAAMAAGRFKAPTSTLQAAGLRSRTALRGKPRSSEG